MSDLAAFLLARVAEDEAVAVAAGGEAWVDMTEETSDGENAYFTIETGHVAYPDSRRVAEVVQFSDLGRAEADHIARHDPARILAECEAKRAIVERRPAIGLPGRDLHHDALAAVHEEVDRQRDYVFRHLALPHADHPDFDPAWRL